MNNEQLAIRIKAGIDASENMLELYKQMKGLIYTIAKHYSGVAELDDLTQEGYIALCNAVNSYEPSGGVKFASYAGVVIRRHLVRYIRGNQLVRVPEGTQTKIYKYKQVRNAFMLETGREPTDRETRYYLRLSDKQLDNLKKAAQVGQVASLDRVLTDEDDDFTLADAIPSADDTEQEITESVYSEQLNAAIWQAVDALPDKQLDIIRRRYMDNATIKAAGEATGITSGMVRREEFKALRALKTKLSPFLPEGSSAYTGGGVGTFNRTWTSSTERCALKLLRSD